ncbi:TraM-binding TraD/TraG-like protein, partial [Dysgonomonas alginatilytica]
MFKMSPQDTRRQARLNELMESCIRRNVYVRFGGEYLETYHCQRWQGVGCLAYGQIASAKIPLSRMISPQLYWVMTGNDFTLDINNPEQPKILCVGNNPDRQNIYSAALGLYNSRIVKLINKKGMLKSSVIIDELPTIYFRGLDNLIATARSNKVAVCLGFQDFSQLNRDYGDKESKVVMNT